MSIAARSTDQSNSGRSSEDRVQLWRYRTLTVIDVFLHVFVVSTFVIGIWRGSYELFAHYHDIVNPWLAFGLCITIQLVLSFTSDPLVKYFKRSGHSKLLFWVTSRAYIYAHFMSGMIVFTYQEWLLDITMVHFQHSVSQIMMTFVAIGILCMFRMVATIMPPPACGLEFDPKPEEIFEFVTMLWPDQSGTGSWLYVLDSFFSVCIIGSLVVIVWRGVWNIMDEYLYPDMEDVSAWLSLVIGYGVVLIAYALQPIVKNIVKRVGGIKRIFIVDTYLLFSFFGAVNVWRGVWTMLNVYFLPDAPVTSYWISHIACFAILVALNSSNSILVRGVYMDAEEDGTQCVDFFPCYYVRRLVQKRKRKKTRNAEQEGKEMIQIKIQQTGETTETVTGKLLSSSITNENGGVITNKMNGDEAEETLSTNNKIV